MAVFVVSLGCGKRTIEATEVAADFVMDRVEEQEQAEATKAGSDPVAYVRDVLKRLDAQEVKLKALRHRDAADVVKLDNDAQLESELNGRRAGKLEQAKAAYRSAEDAQKWPATLDGVEFERSELAALITRAHEDVQRASSKARSLGRARLKREASVKAIDEQLAKLRRSRVAIREKLRLLELKGRDQEVDELVDEIATLHAQGTAFDTDDALEIDVDDLLQLEGAKPEDSADFREIMAM